MKNNEGFLKRDKMTEREFLREFSLWIETGGLVEENPNRTEQDWEDQIDSFLEEFHHDRILALAGEQIRAGDAVYIKDGKMYKCTIDKP